MSVVTEKPTPTKRRLDQEFPGRVMPSKLAHAVFKTPDLARARAWYLDVLNAKVASENQQVCFITYDDEHHRLGFIQMPNLVAPTPNRWGLEHYAFSYATLGALLTQYKYLKTKGIMPYWTVNHGASISFYYRDPDGNNVEFDYDVFETPEQVQAFFASADYKKNIIGILIDPEELITQYEAGVPLKELVQRPPLPPGKTPFDMVRS